MINLMNFNVLVKRTQCQLKSNTWTEIVKMRGKVRETKRIKQTQTRSWFSKTQGRLTNSVPKKREETS